MKSSLARFRVMAIIAGVMSLLLWFVDLPVAYLFNNPEWKAAVAWIPFVHGWVYFQ
jgi:integral membrane protein